MSKRPRRSGRPGKQGAAKRRDEPRRPATKADAGTGAGLPGGAGAISEKGAGNATSPDTMRSQAAGLVLLTGAFAISAFLAWHSLTGAAVPGCSAESGCGEVTGGRWGFLLGVPVSALGAITYAALIALGIATTGRASARTSPSRSRRLTVATATLVVGAAVWFTGVQAFILGAFCPWCCVAHGLAVAGALLVVWRLGCGSRPAWSRAEVLVPAAAVAAFAVLQSVGTPPEQIAIAQVENSGLGGLQEAAGAGGSGFGNPRSAADELPVIGQPDARVVGVAVTDFTCPHCRELHGTLEGIAAAAPGEAAFVLVPGFRDQDAAELHRAMLTVWRDDPALFWDMTHRLAEGALAPEAQAVIADAQPGLRDQFYARAWEHAAWVDSALAAGRGWLESSDAALDVATLPQLIIGSQVIAGTPGADTVRGLVAAAPDTPAAGALSPLPLPAPVAAAVASVRAPGSNVDATPGADGGEPTRAALAPELAGAKIEFTDSRLTLPQVVQGETTEGTFHFRNAGDAPLSITQIKAACGCTAVEGWRQTVPPGGEGSFSVKLDTKRFTGRVSKSIAVTSNATNARNGITNVSVVTDVWLPVRLNTNSASFGTLMAGDEIPPKQIVVTATEPPLDLATPVSSNPYFDIAMETVEPGRQFLVTVAIPRPHAGVEQGKLTIKLGHPKLDHIDLPLYARIAHPVELSPSEIIISPNPSARPQQRFVTAYCHDRKFTGFEVTAVELTGAAGVTASLEPTSSPHVVWRRIRLTIPPGFDAQAAAEGDAQLTVRTNHPDFPELTSSFKLFSSRPRAAR